MTGQIQSRGFFLHREQVPLGQLRHVRDMNVLFFLLFTEAKQIYLSGNIFLCCAGNIVEHRVIYLQQLASAVSQRIKCTGFHQAFQRTAIEFLWIHAVTKILKRCKRTVVRAFFLHLFEESASDIANCRQTKPDIAIGNREALTGRIDIRRQHTDSHTARRTDILRHLWRCVQHAGQQGRHIFLRIMAFHIRRLIRYHRIANSMCFIKRIIGKVHNLIKNRLRRLFIYAALDGAVNAQFLVAVDEVGAFFCQLLHLFLGHRAAHHIRLAKRISRQHAENFHNLFLIDHTAIRDIQNIF